jgi:hypothetical protein
MLFQSNYFNDSVLSHLSLAISKLNLKSIFKFLFYGSIFKESERPWKNVFLFIIPLCLLFTFFERTTHPLKEEIGADGHLLSSLNIAYADTFCGTFSHSLPLFKTDTNVNIPINQLLVPGAHDITQNCKTTHLTIQNEVGLLQIFKVLFTLFPTMSLADLSTLLTFVKLSCFLFFALVLLRIGLSPTYILFTSVFAHFLLSMLSFYHQLTLYTFLIPYFTLFLSTTIIYADLIKNIGYKMIPFGVILGLLGAFYCNLRTSHQFLVFFIIASFLVGLFLYISNGASLQKRMIICLSCLISIYLGFQFYSTTWIKPLQVISENNNLTNHLHHATAHPLVLALGIDKSDFTENEGIQWLDSKALDLAHTIDPTVTYLGKNYDKALFVYYLKLWLYHPSEMLSIYKEKFSTFKTLNIDNIVKPDYKSNTDLLMRPINKIYTVFNKFMSVWLLLAGSFALLMIFRERVNLLGFVLALSVLGSFTLLLFESTIIMHHFVLIYHALANLLYFMIMFYYIQISLNLVLNFFDRYNRRKEVTYAR